MRKGDDGEKNGKKNGKKKKKKKIKTFLVATKVVASRPPERRPTGTPTAHANIGRYVVKPKLKTISGMKKKRKRKENNGVFSGH